MESRIPDTNPASEAEPTPRHPLPPGREENPKVTPLDENKNLEEGIEIHET